MLKQVVLFLFAAAALFLLLDGGVRPTLGQAANTSARSPQERSPVIRLGERLFRDDRFSTPNGDLINSCSHCHMLDEDPQGVRAYTDFFIKSWLPFREDDPRRLMVRNSPTILDAGEMSRLHYDGEFSSLEELVKGTFAGRPMGWLPGEEEKAYDQMRAVVLNDAGSASTPGYTYLEQFQKAFQVDLKKLSREETVDLIARAVANYCRTLTTRKNSPYDKFIAVNRLEKEPADGETGVEFAGRLLGRLKALEAKKTLRLTREFDHKALQGLKVFLQADRGNCASCHAPPLFTDQSFHNIGISQREYDRLHGEGKFATLPIPDADVARRPAATFRETPSSKKPGEADLGFWNFIDLKTSTLRRPGESDDRLLRRMIAAFKTPTLRNLNYTQPYFHDGSLHSLEEVLTEMMTLSEMARGGRLREADDELAKIRLTPSDIPALVAFLNTLNEDMKKHVLSQ